MADQQIDLGPHEEIADPFLAALHRVRESSPTVVRARKQLLDERAAALLREEAARSMSPPPADDPFLAALAAVRQQQSTEPPPAEPSATSRILDRLIDLWHAANEPLLPSIGTAATALEQRLSEPSLLEQRINDVLPGAGTAAAMARGMGAGVVGGAGRLLAGQTSPIGIGVTAASLGAGPAASLGLTNTARGLRAIEAATGGAFAAEGLNRAVDSDLPLEERAMGVAQAAGGALGVRGGVQGLRNTGRVPPVVPRQPVGDLPPGPSFVANESGIVARAGDTIPMVEAPDGSFVRGVPAEYARRDVRGALPPGPDFIADATGRVAPLAQADDAFLNALSEVRSRAPAGPDPSAVRSVPAAPMAYERQGRSLVPSLYSGDVNATPAPVVDLTPELSHALRRILADMDAHRFTRRSFVEAGRGRGGDLDVVPGAAGSAIYRVIIGDGPDVGRDAVIRATENLLAGKRTPVGDRVLDVAHRIAAGDRVGRLLTLPPEAGNLPGEMVPAFRVERLANLSPDRAAVQERAARAVEADPDGLVAQYRQRFDNVISADSAKELFPDYAASNAARTANDLAVHRPASALAQRAYEQMLQEPTPVGKEEIVLFTAGGTGAGKTTGVSEVFPALRDSAHIVYDSTLSKPEAAIRNIEKARSSGHAVAVVFTDRDINEAFAATLERAREQGRPVTINTHVRSHTGANETFAALQERFGADSQVEFFVLRNSRAGRELVPLSEWQPKVYDESSVRADLSRILEDAHRSGQADDALREAVRPALPGAGRDRTADSGGAHEAAPSEPSAQQVAPQSFPTSGPGHSRPAVLSAKRQAAETGRSFYIERVGESTDVVSDQRPAGPHTEVTPDGQLLNGAARSGESGQINPMLAARLAGGGIGAAYGYASGEDTADSLARAGIYGAAGLVAPSLLHGGGAVAAGTARISGQRGKVPSLRTIPRTPVPPATEIPKSRLLEFPSLQKMPEEVRGDIAQLLEQHGGFAEQRRNVQPIARTEALADRIEVPLKKLRPGTALNAEELSAYSNAVASVMVERQPLADKVKAGTATNAEKVKFSELTDRATVLVESFRGAKAEAGRSLHALRTKASVLDFGDAAFIEQLLKAPGFEDDLKRVADAVTQAAGDPVRQLELLQQASRGSRFERSRALFYSGILSGIRSQLRNFLGNGLNAIANLTTPIAASGADVARSAMTGAPRSVFLGELKPGVVGFFTGVPDGFRQALFTLQHGFTPKAVSLAAEGKFDAVRVSAPGGIVTNLPLRLLESVDVFFREPARRQELYSAAYAQARREGLTTSADIQSRMTALVLGDTLEGRAIRDQAERFAARAVFQEPAGPITQKILSLKNDPSVSVGARAAMTFVLPFVKTPSNILKQGAEFSPLGFFMGAVRQEGREGAQALGRAAAGTAAAGYFAYLAATGKLTGAGPTEPGERAAFMESGKRPNSILIQLSRADAKRLQAEGVEMEPVRQPGTGMSTGNYWVNYQLLQPFSVQLAAMGNAWERFAKSDRSDRAAEASLAAALSGVGASFVDQSYLAAVNDLLDAVADPERNGYRVLSTFAQGVFPASGLARNLTQAIDPVIRRPETIAESVKTIVPGLSQTVPPRRGRFGQELVRPGGAIQRGFLVPEVSEETSDPVGRMLDELGITPQVPRVPRIMVNGEPVKFSRDEEDTIVQAIGIERRNRLERLLASPVYSRLTTPGARERAVRRELSDATAGVDSRVRAYMRRGAPLTVEKLITAFSDAR